MREIKLRGYATEEMVCSQWMYGTGIHKTVFTDEYAERTGIKEEWFIFTDSGWVQVEPKSIGQHTGLKDMNGVEIYEGDIIKFHHEENGIETEEVADVMWFGDSEWEYPAFDLDGSKLKEHHFVSNSLQEIVTTGFYKNEVIGNIYENLELIK